MQRVNSYRLVTSTNQINLETLVNSYLKDGYQPFGSVSHTPHGYWVQTVVKYEQQ